VDDSKSFLQAARTFLEREGLTVAGIASTGNDALLRTEELRPDVVLVDLTLGDESGFDLARRLVEKDRRRRSPVILISTHAAADFEDLIAASPAVGFLPKSELSASAISRILVAAER
jgi:DNA-binding NarL/FixJ family response regulator